MPQLITTDLLRSGVPLAEKVVRSVIVYAFLVALLRFAGKRTLGSFNSFDLVVLLLLSNTVQNAIVGNDTSLVGGLVGAAALVAVNWLLVRTMYYNHRMDHLVESGPTVLVRHGQLVEDNLRRQLITRGELLAAARRQGIDRLSDIRIARLETGGAVTFELAAPTAHDRQLMDIAARLERIEQALDRVERPGGTTQPADSGADVAGGPER